MAKYTVYHGDFRCQECKAKVKTIRMYPDTKQLTWMCEHKHLSKVDLNTRRKRNKDE